MALKSQLCVPSIPDLVPPTVTGSRSNSKKAARIPRSAWSAFCRKDVGEKLYYTGTVRSLPKRGRKQREWVLQASGENEVVSTEEKTVAADSTGTKKVEQNGYGPHIFAFLDKFWFFEIAFYVIYWFIGRFYSNPWIAHIQRIGRFTIRMRLEQGTLKEAQKALVDTQLHHTTDFTS